MIWELVEKGLSGSPYMDDIVLLKALLAQHEVLNLQVMEFLETYDDPDPQIRPEEKQWLLRLLNSDELATYRE